MSTDIAISRALHTDSILSASMGETAVPLQVFLWSGGPELITRISGEWDELCDHGNPELSFLRPALVTAYINAFAPDDPVLLLVAYRGRRLVAVLPLQERYLGAGPVGMTWLRFAGNVHFVRCDVISRDEDPDLIAREFWTLLRARQKWNLIQIDVAPMDGIVARMRALAAAEGAATGIHNPGETPYIGVPDPTVGIDDLIAAQGKSLRGSLRRGGRRLGERGAFEFVVIREGSPEGDITDWVDRLCDLEHRGWKGEAGTSINSDASTRAFYSSLARDPALRRSLVCLALVLDGEMVAGDIGLLAGNTYFGMKIAHDEAYRDCSPGHVLMLHELLALSRMGYSEFDMGGRAEPYKLFWTSTTRPFGRVFIFRKSLRGRLLHWAFFTAGEWLRERVVKTPLAAPLRKMLG